MQCFTKSVARVLIAVVALCAARLAAGQEQPGRFPLTAAAVIRALQRAGVPVDMVHLQMPQNLTANSNQPSLQIAGAELLSDGGLRLRISCERVAECQPFFVDTAGKGHETDLVTLASLRPTLPGPETRNAPNRAVLRAGAQVQMLLEDERMRISIPVVTIDTGTVGAEVRVSSLDHKQTFRAFVVSAAVVRGVLP